MRSTTRHRGDLIEALESRILLTSYSLDVLAQFTGEGAGARPVGQVVVDAQGDIYGVTIVGGTDELGTLFKVAAGARTATIVHQFTGTGGSAPVGNLVLDSHGNLFGITQFGGAKDSGTLFELPAGSATLQTLYSFDPATGASPAGGLVVDANDNIYGTAQTGGANGNGIIFKLPAGSATPVTIATFEGTNGRRPIAPLVIDASGDLFGATARGGSADGGVIYELPAGSSTPIVLTSLPYSNPLNIVMGLVLDSYGNLFGTTLNGGSDGLGSVFELRSGSLELRSSGGGYTFSTIANFNGSNGTGPQTGLLIDAQGNLYGTTRSGGQYDLGTIWELPAAGTAPVILHNFNTPEGVYPAGIAFDHDGNIVGVNNFGGVADVGTVFRLNRLGLPATELGFVNAIPDTPSGQVIAPAITVQTQTQWGDRVASSVPVTLTLVSGPPGGQIAGTATVTAVNGVATFSDISFSTVGAYVLAASSPGLATSAATVVHVTTALPLGFLDSADRARVVGWAFDPDAGAAAVNVRIDIDGVQGIPFAADAPRPDLISYAPVGSANHGFVFNLPTLAAGAHSVDVYVQEYPTSYYYKLASGVIPADHPPTGWIDQLDRSGFAGWGFDQDAGANSIYMRLDIDGVAGVPFLADIPRGDLATSPLVGSPNHGASLLFGALSPAAHTVDVYVQDAPESRFIKLGTRTIAATTSTDAATPIGFVDTADRTRITGWAHDADAGASAVLVRVDIDGVAGAPFLANLARPDLVTYAPVGSANHGFSFALPLLTGAAHTVDVYVQEYPTTNFVKLDSRVVPALATTSTATPFGWIDATYTAAQAGATTIVGWAFDKDAGTGPIVIRIDVDGVPTTYGLANLGRADLTAYAPVGSPNHGFSIALPTLAPFTHTFDVWMEDYGTNTFVKLGTVVANA